MEYKDLFLDTKLPVIGLGTWEIGGDLSPDHSNDKESIEAIRNAIKLGYTHIDTAELYGSGHCEELVGEAIKDFDRKRLFVTTKVHKTNLRYNDVITSCKNSLRRLQTDYINLYLIHSFNPNIPLEETMKAFDYLVEQEFVRFIGVSNFRGTQIEGAQKYSKNKIVVNQIEYNLAMRNGGMSSNNVQMEKEAIPYCQSNDVIVVAYSPFDRGSFLRRKTILDKLSKKYNKTKAQISLNWLISKEGVVTIPKSTNIEHLKENLGAVGWRLEAEDIELLNNTNFESPSL